MKIGTLYINEGIGTYADFGTDGQQDPNTIMFGISSEWFDQVTSLLLWTLVERSPEEPVYGTCRKESNTKAPLPSSTGWAYGNGMKGLGHLEREGECLWWP